MKMKKLFLLFSIVFVFFNCSKESDNPVDKPKPKAPLVKIEVLEPKLVQKSIKLIGTIEAKTFANVISPMDGFIEKLFVSENDFVKKNKELAIIGSQERITLISQAKNKLLNLKKELDKLNKNNENYETLSKQYEEAKKELDYAEKLYLGTPVISPLEGKITQKFVETGSSILSKQVLFNIVDFNSLVIKTSISEDLYSKIKIGDVLKAKLNAFPDKIFKAKVVLKYQQIDPATRNFPVELKITESNKEIAPGMMAELELITDRKENIIAVPNDVFIVNQKGEKIVYVVKDTVAHQRVVTTGISDKELTEVTSGLNFGEKIVVVGQELLKDGIKVMIQKPKQNKENEAKLGGEKKK